MTDSTRKSGEQIELEGKAKELGGKVKDGQLSAADAATEVRARWKGEGGIASVTRTSAEDPPLEARSPCSPHPASRSSDLPSSNGAHSR